jgi:hypothetical protein
MYKIILLALISLVFISCSSSKKVLKDPFPTFISGKDLHLSQYIDNETTIISLVRAKSNNCNFSKVANYEFINLKKGKTYKIDKNNSIFISEMDIDPINCKISIQGEISLNAYKKTFFGSKRDKLVKEEVENTFAFGKLFSSKAIEKESNFEILTTKYKYILEEKYKKYSFLKKEKSIISELRFIKIYGDNTFYAQNFSSLKEIITNSLLTDFEKNFAIKYLTSLN